ncbi:dihydroorotate dehydrogenase (fumarate) [Rhinocladiella mackenziei CBS 650.93]|uniref:Dihydroorotate dehydrogenase (quinone), mitochondrial n=1 Tax=Rhinocladiella mackenziei CBS 650.93 TaxID=1442369 RepID=A0A0D2FKG1_9EURO|nr:dihydroorotate dehydrogenase (fumarate) [Rhinocladiella mackenziei CBS 650.93]KIX02432.1 dihydroorotate dehydrogenase (fumarate) [Rhinocladiella mackenziei CBS 650.93]
MKHAATRLLLRAPHPRVPIHSPPFRPRFANPPIRRHASTSEAPPSFTSHLLNGFYGATLILGLGIIYVYVTDIRASAHRYIVIPALRLVYRDPEEAHHAGNRILKSLWEFNLHPRERGDPDRYNDLEVEIFGHMLRNPVATSAGIDKHADIPDPLFAIGPAIVEIGGTTPLPQEGNAKPRVFRLSSQQAMINRYGLNSEGADHVAMRLRNRVRKFAHSLGLGDDEIAEKAVLDGIAGVPPGSLIPGKLLAVNIAKNKFTPEDDVEAVTNDYVYCVDKLGPYADILVVNVSSPNTPGLRSLQRSDKLQTILAGVVKAAKSVDRRTKPVVMVKVSPDEDSDAEIAGICDAVWATGVDGVIVGNTTNRRPASLPHLKDLSPREERHLLEKGGFSGPHLFDRTVSLVTRYRKLLAEKPAPAEAIEKPPSPVATEAEKIPVSLEASSEAPSTLGPNSVAISADTDVTPPRDILEKDDSTEADQTPPGESDEAGSSPLAPPVGERERLKSIQAALERLPPRARPDAMAALETAVHSDSIDQPKVIFATGGITNGKQALQVLNAGASVAMVYTALVYGGIGTISRIKDEMREEMKRQAEEKRPKAKE